MATRFAIELVDADDADALQRAIDAVSTYGETRYIRRGENVIAVLQPPADTPGPNRWTEPEPRPFTRDDPLFQAAGIFAGDGSGDVSARVDDYLAEAYDERHK